MKRSLLSKCIFLSVTLLMLTITCAAINTNVKYEELLGQAASKWASEVDAMEMDPEYEVISLIVANPSTRIEETYVEFVDVIAVLPDGLCVNVSPWTTAVFDEEIISYDRGRIDALECGETLLEISYGNQSVAAVVEVIPKTHEHIDTNNQGFNMVEPLDLEAGRILARANACEDNEWTPAQNLVGWNGQITYNANRTYSGLPYSQCVQAYPVTYSGFATTSFSTCMTYSDFYTTYTDIYNNTMPRYGLDCSGFLSYCWGINRVNTVTFKERLYQGTYDPVGDYEPTSFISNDGSYTVKSLSATMKATLKEAYGALVHYEGLVNNGHCMLVMSNSPSSNSVIVLEQTPSGTMRRTYSYDTLANSRYLPFTY